MCVGENIILSMDVAKILVHIFGGRRSRVAYVDFPMDACKTTSSAYESDVFCARLNQSSMVESVRWKISIRSPWRI